MHLYPLVLRHCQRARRAAADDPLFGNSGSGIVDSWQRSGAPVELHCYEHGGHGFGLHHHGTSSDPWPEQLVQWLEARGTLGKRTQR